MTKCMVEKLSGNPAGLPELKFKELVLAWAKKVHAEPKRIQLQKMTQKWASCSTIGQITFNSALIKKPLKFQEAVIVHELVHLLVPNHGKLFRSMFLSFMPDGKRLLNEKAYVCDKEPPWAKR